MTARLHRSEYTVTRTGLTIGAAHIPQRHLREVTRSEEQVQAALLAKPRRIDWPTILLAVCAVVSFAVLLIWSR